MRHNDSSQHTHNHHHRTAGKRRGNPCTHSLSPFDMHQRQFINKRKSDNRYKSDNPAFDHPIGIRKKHNNDKNSHQDSPNPDRYIEQHLQSNSTSENFSKRSRHGSPHRAPKHRSGIRRLQISHCCFRQTKSCCNTEVGDVMLQYDQHNRR